MNNLNNRNDNQSMWIILGLIALVAAALIWYLVYYSKAPVAAVPTERNQSSEIATAEEAITLNTLPTANKQASAVEATAPEELTSTQTEALDQVTATDEIEPVEPTTSEELPSTASKVETAAGEAPATSPAPDAVQNTLETPTASEIETAQQATE